MSARQLSASSNKRKVKELSTSSTIDPQSNLELNTICVRREIRYDRIHNVMSHPLSKYFKAAAKDVINKEGGTVETLAQRYELNTQEYHEILDKRIDIIRQKRKYLKLKDKIENAVKLISFQNLPGIAQISNIDELKLREEFQKYLKNRNGYEYDEFTSSNKILTYKEEFSLLTLLQKWRNDQLSCHCVICAIEFLCMQAHLIYTSREESPRKWSIQEEINWLCEFEVRHNKKISEYLAPDIIEFLASSDLDIIEKYPSADIQFLASIDSDIWKNIGWHKILSVLYGGQKKHCKH